MLESDGWNFAHPVPFAMLTTKSLTLSFKLAKVPPVRRSGLILSMARISQRMSRQELAANIGVHEETIRMWEAGKNDIMPEKFEDIESALKQDIESLIDSPESPRFFVSELDPQKRLGLILWMARVGQDMTRPEVAECMSVVERTVYFWEIGQRSLDSIMLIRIGFTLRQDMGLFWS